MLVPGADRLALSEHVIITSPTVRVASQGNNPADLQGVPG